MRQGLSQCLWTAAALSLAIVPLAAQSPLPEGAERNQASATAAWTAASTLTLAPPATNLPVGGQATLIARLLDNAHQPVAGAPVLLTVLAGPDSGTTGQAITDSAGRAVFTYTGAVQGVVLLQAAAGSQRSNLVTTIWTAAAATVAPAAAEPLAVPAGIHRYSIYSSELHLIAETELSTAPRPAILNEYIWFNGRPIAQIDANGVTSWTFTDHLGTPILQTSATQGVTWRAEYEPYGQVYALRSYDRHQPLRLPGQEAEQLGPGANGATERSYNIHRWYRGGWGRYSQADPLGFASGPDPYAYATDQPTRKIDSQGLTVTNGTACVLWVKEETSSATYAVPPGRSGKEDQDGYADPCKHPNQIFKAVGQTKKEEMDGEDIDVDVRHEPHTTLYADSLTNYTRTSGARAFLSGWKDQNWYRNLSEDNKKQWKELFEKAKPENCLCPCKVNSDAQVVCP